MLGMNGFVLYIIICNQEGDGFSIFGYCKLCMFECYLIYYYTGRVEYATVGLINGTKIPSRGYVTFESVAKGQRVQNLGTFLIAVSSKNQK